jgi:4-hydroxy-2-oxoheptanedioate aldolase
MPAPAESPRSFHARLPEGVDGLFVKLATLETLEMAAQHFDFCVVDLEHSALGESDALRVLQHARAIGFPALLRLPEVDAGLINRALEVGAIGIHLAGVTGADDVRAARAAMDYPPAGRRSASTTHASASFGATGLRDYLEQAIRPVLVAAIESEASDDSIERIVAAGADVAFVGLSDLSVACGFDQARVDARVEEIAKAARAAGIALGGFGLARHDAQLRVSTSDVSLFATAAASARTGPPPEARPIVATWAEIPDEPVRPGIRRRGFGNDSALLVLNACEPGMELRPHSHEFDQIAVIVAGSGHYWIAGIRHAVGPDSLLLIPAGVEHYIEPGEETILNLDLFAPARPDYLHLIEWMATHNNPTEGGLS